MSVTARDVGRAEAMGRLAAGDGLDVDACPYRADGSPDDRLLAARWVRAYLGAGGNAGFDDEGEQMPEREITARGGAKRWRTVKLPNGRYVKVAVVPKAGPRGGHTIAGPEHTKKG